MRGEFVFIVDGKIVEVNDYNQIPKKFQHVIKFLPEIPPPPHTEDEHAMMEDWHKKLQDLIAIENQQNASRNHT